MMVKETVKEKREDEAAKTFARQCKCSPEMSLISGVWEEKKKF